MTKAEGQREDIGYSGIHIALVASVGRKSSPELISQQLGQVISVGYYLGGNKESNEPLIASTASSLGAQQGSRSCLSQTRKSCYMQLVQNKL